MVGKEVKRVRRGVLEKEVGKVKEKKKEGFLGSEEGCGGKKRERGVEVERRER